MKQVIVITGTSSGFGLLSANALAKTGHIVYASMRDTTGRNAPQVEAAAKFAKENGAASCDASRDRNLLDGFSESWVQFAGAEGGSRRKSRVAIRAANTHRVEVKS